MNTKKGVQGFVSIPQIDRFLAKVSIPRDVVTGCWMWTAGKSTCGYGKFRASTQSDMPAHRFAYESFVGEVCSGLELDHLCRVRACVNPAHLEPVTHAENMRRSAVAGNAWTRGERHGNAKLTDAQAAIIRLDPRKAAIVAAEYRVSVYVIYEVRSGRTYSMTAPPLSMKKVNRC